MHSAHYDIKELGNQKRAIYMTVVQCAKEFISFIRRTFSKTLEHHFYKPNVYGWNILDPTFYMLPLSFHFYI